VKLVVRRRSGPTGDSDGQLKQLREYYGFDKPLPVPTEYGCTRRPAQSRTVVPYNEPVLQVIVQRLPVSIYYGL